MKASASAGLKGCGMPAQRANLGIPAGGQQGGSVRGAPRSQDELVDGQDRARLVCHPPLLP